MTKIVIVGEAWGKDEEAERAPFVGVSGWLLTQMLNEAGIQRADCFLTNVFNLHPPGNDILWFCGEKSEAIKGYPPLSKGKYVRQEFIPELERLADELVEHDPNLVICLGNTPLWALAGKTGVSKLRGTTLISDRLVDGIKLLPTYHPAYILRQWNYRPTVVIDLMKAFREQEYPEIRRPEREVWIEPTLEDMYVFRDQYISGCRVLSVDIETAGNYITCIGFAPECQRALVVPFFDFRRVGRSYWPNVQAEREAWNFIRQISSDGEIKKVFQNGMYDIAFLLRAYGIRVRGANEDTMLLHHSLQPESLKALDYLGSIYTDEGAWKQMRKKRETIKRDD